MLLHKWLFLTLCPVTILLSATLLTFCVPYQMLLNSLIRKHMYSYISENNFGSSNQILVPTGYNLYSCQILMQLEISRQIFQKYSNIRFDENSSNGSRVAELFHAYWRTDVTKLIVAFRNFANASKKTCSHISEERKKIWNDNKWVCKEETLAGHLDPHLQYPTVQVAIYKSVKLTSRNQALRSEETKTSCSPPKSPHSKHSSSQFLA
jgi:hypothetical protein